MRSRSAARASAESHRKACCTSGTSDPPRLIVRLASPLTPFVSPLSGDRSTCPGVCGREHAGVSSKGWTVKPRRPNESRHRGGEFIDSPKIHLGSSGQHIVRPPPYGDFDDRGGVTNVTPLDAVTVQRLRPGTDVSRNPCHLCGRSLLVVATRAWTLRAENKRTRA